MSVHAPHRCFLQHYCRRFCRVYARRARQQRERGACLSGGCLQKNESRDMMERRRKYMSELSSTSTATVLPYRPEVGSSGGSVVPPSPLPLLPSVGMEARRWRRCSEALAWRHDTVAPAHMMHTPHAMKARGVATCFVVDIRDSATTSPVPP